MIDYIKKLDDVITRIEAARKLISGHHIVKIVAVSKYSTSQEVEALYRAGQRAYGENKVQDLKLKMQELDEHPLEWHFIGNLQKNKINHLIDADPFLMQSLSSYDLAQELNKRLGIKEKKMDCLLQINSALEESKGGVHPDDATDMYKRIQDECEHINLKGVMSIGAHTQDEALIKKSFDTTFDIYANLEDATICSMGMSSDYELAIAHGSNLVRIGSALFK